MLDIYLLPNIRLEPNSTVAKIIALVLPSHRRIFTVEITI